jgi:uncharacterized membrane protein
LEEEDISGSVLFSKGSPQRTTEKTHSATEKIQFSLCFCIAGISLCVLRVFFALFASKNQRPQRRHNLSRHMRERATEKIQFSLRFCIAGISLCVLRVFFALFASKNQRPQRRHNLSRHMRERATEKIQFSLRFCLAGISLCVLRVFFALFASKNQRPGFSIFKYYTLLIRQQLLSANSSCYNPYRRENKSNPLMKKKNLL